MQMIKETCVAIKTLEDEWQREIEVRYARKRKIRYIDNLLDEFERLNLVDEGDVPQELQSRVVELVSAERHPSGITNFSALTISEWMETLYDVQDTLMIPLEEEERMPVRGRG
ncbi:MAG: hypothetical protein ACP5OR_04495 [Candidatus Dormibacteria bacterium]